MTLPNFMIIGVAKAGTTSLYHYLDQHPQVFMCPDKGTNYFGYEDARDWKWTEESAAPSLQNFPVRSFEAYEAKFAGASNHIAIGEVSPQYLRCPTAAQRIHACIPQVKLVVSLRNPAERAFSGFLMRTRRGEAVKDFYDELTPDSSHVKESYYYRRLKRYFDLFPRQQIKVYIFDEFKKSPNTVISDLFGFVGVDPTFKPDTSTTHNPAAVPKIRILNRLFFDPTLIRLTKAVLPQSIHELAKQIQQKNLKPAPKLSPELRARLIGFYRQDIHQLETLLERDLSIWLN